MQRPVLNPSFLDDPDFDIPKPRRPWRKLIVQAVLATLRGVLRALMWRPFSHPPVQPTGEEDQTTPTSWAGLALRRIAFVPIVLVMIVAAMVYRGTHPVPYDPGRTPAAMGIYYEPIAMLAADGQRLEGWLVPAFDARSVVEQQEAMLRVRRPAVVLVHDHDFTRGQMLPLVQPLHRAGWVVLVMGMRGEGTGSPGSRTFGLRESMDVHAAVQMLRRRASVDAARIAVIGSGTGATAALLAGGQDVAISAMVLDSPLHHTDQMLTRIGPAHAWLAWLRPICKWAFEFSHAVDADDLNLTRHRQVLDNRPVLMLGGPSHVPAAWTPQTIDQVIAFLEPHLIAQPAVATTQ